MKEALRFLQEKGLQQNPDETVQMTINEFAMLLNEYERKVSNERNVGTEMFKSLWTHLAT